VLAALRQGLVIGPDRGPFGGLPGCLRPDRGLEFAAAALRQAAFALGVTLLPAPPYAPHLKGKVERFGGTLTGELRVLPPAASTVAADGHATPITLAGLAAELADLVAAYNARSHQGLGGLTPLARWQADPTPIRQVDPAQVRWLLLGGETRTITKHGIRFGGLHVAVSYRLVGYIACATWHFVARFLPAPLVGWSSLRQPADHRLVTVDPGHAQRQALNDPLLSCPS
jgi:putative transposase